MSLRSYKYAYVNIRLSNYYCLKNHEIKTKNRQTNIQTIISFTLFTGWLTASETVLWFQCAHRKTNSPYFSQRYFRIYNISRITSVKHGKYQLLYHHPLTPPKTMASGPRGRRTDSSTFRRFQDVSKLSTSWLPYTIVMSTARDSKLRRQSTDRVLSTRTTLAV